MSGSLYLQWTDASGAQRRLYFDCCETLGAEHITAITDNPVERGANVSDHARSNPDSLTLSVLVTNSPTDDLPDGSRVSSRGSVSLSVPRYVVEGRTGIGRGRPKGRGVLVSETNNVMVYRAGNFVQEAYDTLEELRQTNTLLTVGTGYKLFQSMLLTQVKPSEDAESGDSMTFAIQVRQIRIVQSELVNVPIIPEGKKPVTKGKQDPQDSKKAATQTSVAKGIENLIPDSVKQNALAFLGLGG